MKWFLPVLFLAACPVMGEAVSPDVLDRLPSAEIVLLGEVHDNPVHHANQARAVAALRPRAIVFEMLTPEQARAATPEARSDAARLSAALSWEGSGWPDFAMYWPIFAAAPDAAIHGAQVTREAMSGARAQGLSTFLGTDAARFGLDAPLAAADQAAAEAEQRRAHCDMLPENLIPMMVEAQRLRDAALARAALAALTETGGPVAVITGNGHARASAVPAAIARAEPGVSVLSLGQLEAPAEGDTPFDLWLVTPPADRKDPCEALRRG